MIIQFVYHQQFNWEAIGAIGQVAGAIATFLAVLIALKSNKGRIEIKVIEVHLDNRLSAYKVRFINVGPANIKVIVVGIKLGSKKYYGDSTRGVPFIVEPEDDRELNFQLNWIGEAMKKSGFKGRRSFRFYCHDNKGDNHYSRKYYITV